MITNIGTKLEDLNTYIKSIPAINTEFWWQIYTGKPADEVDGKYMYMNLVDNSAFVTTANETLKKRATIDFVLFGDNTGSADLDLYDSLDVLVNGLVTECVPWIDIGGGFIIHSIEEWNSAGIVYEKERPFLITEFFITYKSKY